MGRPRVVVVASDLEARRSIAAIVDALDMEVIAMPRDGEDAVATVARLEPDLACLVVPLEGSLDAPEVARSIAAIASVPVVFCGDSGAPQAVDAARRAGVQGYVIHGSPLEQYRAVFGLALRPGRDAPGPSLVDRHMRARSPNARSGTYALEPDRRTASRVGSDILSVREREVFELLVQGTRIADTADRLFISTHTVRKHTKAIFRKLQVHSQVELMRCYGPRRRSTTPYSS